jgi:hypothetical protein
VRQVKAVSEPSDLPTTPEGWAAVVAGVAAGLVAARKALQKVGLLRSGPDFDAMAEAFFRLKAQEDAQHREALIAAIEKLCDVTREQHAATRRELREVNDATRERIADLMAQIVTGMTAANTKLDMLVGRRT